MRLILFATMAAGCYAQTTINPAAITCNKPCTDALASDMARTSSGVESTLVSGIDAQAVSITVAVAEWTPPVNSVLSLGSAEHVRVTAKTGLNVLTITRGVNGTTATAHAAGALVTDLRFRNFDAFARAILIDRIRRAVAEDDKQNAAIKQAQNDRDAAVAAAVQ